MGAACRVQLLQLPVHACIGRLDRIAHLMDLRQRHLAAMLLQPQPVAQHFLLRLAHRVDVIAGNGLDFAAGIAQPRLERIGRIQQLRKRLLATATTQVLPRGRGQQRRQHGADQQQDRLGQGQRLPDATAFSLAQVPGGGKSHARGHIDSPLTRQRTGLTALRRGPNIPPLMSNDVLGIVDVWRMVATRREFIGRVPLARFERLRESLADEDGEVEFRLGFDRDALGVPYVELQARAGLPLLCQRSLQRFEFPVDIRQRLGLIREETDEAALPDGYEPLLLPEDGRLHGLELIEDELILALPVVPVAPGTQAMQREWSASEEERAQANPFAALAGLKKDR